MLEINLLKNKNQEIQKYCMAELELEKYTILRYKVSLTVSTSLHGQIGLFISFRVIYPVS